jgi:hypothetical protein
MANPTQKQIVTASNRDSYNHAARKRQHANRIYWILFGYMLIVAVNAAGLVVLFVLTTLSIISVPYAALGAWAVGTGGMGAGSLIFRKPMKTLFELGAN